MSLQGGKLAGGNPANGRVENDFYATNPVAVEMLFNSYKPKFSGNRLLEPSVGQGHILKGVESCFPGEFNVTAVDIVDRGVPDTIVHDYLTWQTVDKFDLIITNPPFSLAEAFCRKSMDLLTVGGVYCVCFSRYSFLRAAAENDFLSSFLLNTFMYFATEWLLGIMVRSLMYLLGSLSVGQRLCATLGLCGSKDLRVNLQ